MTTSAWEKKSHTYTSGK